MSELVRWKSLYRI